MGGLETTDFFIDVDIFSHLNFIKLETVFFSLVIFKREATLITKVIALVSKKF